MPSSSKGRRRLVHLRRRPSTPDLARVVPHLEPRVLYEVVRRQGLEESGEIVALATSEQLLRVFDVDLWRSDEAGGEERLDADRFGRWLEVLHEAGPALAARKIAEMDLDFVTAVLAEHLLVLDSTWFLLEALVEQEAGDTIDVPSEGPLEKLYARVIEGDHAHEIGGYRVLARRAGSWDALVSLLVELGAGHPDFFGRLMGRLARVSTELLDDEDYEFLPGAHETVAGDVAAARDERREAEGYVTPVMAAAFLAAARALRLQTMASPPPWDPVTAAWSRAAERRATARDETTPGGVAGNPATPPDPARDVADFMAVLRRAGALPRATPPLLMGARGGDRLDRIRAQMRDLQEHEGDLHARRLEELGFVANVLVAGASFNGQPFRPSEAARAAAAVCNLGLENWPREWLPGGRSVPPPDFLVHHDLVTLFRVGWCVLHERVGLHTARRVVEILSGLTTEDGGLYGGLADLREGLRKQVDAGTPWRGRDDLDALLALDPPTWSVLVGLVDQCPVVPKEPSGFEFIAENRQVEWVHQFLQSLTERWGEEGGGTRCAPSYGR